MSEHEWGKEGIFDLPQMRREVEQRIEIERPADHDVARAPAPPVPEQAVPALRAVLENPQLAAELWRQVDLGPPPVHVPHAEPRPPDAVAAVQLGMALYLLHALHAPDKPGYEHLIRGEGTLPGSEDEDDDDPDAERP
jgi:hypothetical protein